MTPLKVIYMENMRFFPLKVVMPNGQVYTKSVYACTKWHAMEILYSTMSEYQPNRAMYKVARRHVQIRQQI
jgi:ribosomal protein L20A (L18A)